MPSPWARPLFEGDLDQRYADTIEFPGGDSQEYFVLPKLPDEEFVAYLTFSWRTEEVNGHPRQVGGFRVYFVHRDILERHRKAEQNFDAPPENRKAIPTFIVRFESPNKATWRYYHAQVSNDKFGTLDYPTLKPLPRIAVPNGAPHLPLDTCDTPSGLLISIALSLYGSSGEVYNAIAGVSTLNGHERALLERFASGA